MSKGGKLPAHLLPLGFQFTRLGNAPGRTEQPVLNTERFSVKKPPLNEKDDSGEGQSRV